ncbi:hypothetical protein A1O3_07653 [Capronia epimyces CBS 606.96]|uniref:Peptidase C14 caspase domain-containing protein n=1 Tax=Capronia epimyces CBS 606.96 TaxID=1182542 RepID=W9XLI6_9EURO|nr:uncharacterized protein A1O3_07653 [Capronia epimyces CBS 606.96]EXJ81362.1 hypothetical protein A1O3_07653 [Capronia epimyces CBS 606.96]
MGLPKLSPQDPNRSFDPGLSPGNYPILEAALTPSNDPDSFPEGFVGRGRRRAVLIGINYFGQRGELQGCVDDVKNMSAYLSQAFGYPRENMVTLTDDQYGLHSQPTKANILRAMHWLVQDARPSDVLFFYYSGHGGQALGDDGGEGNRDQVIYPVDFRADGVIQGEELHRIMVKSLAPGVGLTIMIDTRHHLDV